MFLCNNISTGLAISVPHRSDHVPIIGIKKVKMTVEILPNATELFPEALTCHSLLLLPNYRGHPTKETGCWKPFTTLEASGRNDKAHLKMFGHTIHPLIGFIYLAQDTQLVD